MCSTCPPHRRVLISIRSSYERSGACRYSHGCLTGSELIGKPEHTELQERVEARSVAAVLMALRARRVAQSIQVRDALANMADTCLARSLGSVAMLA